MNWNLLNYFLRKPSGGTTGQVLKKTSTGEAWENETSGFSNPMTAAADSIVGGVNGAPGRLAKGTALQYKRMNADATAQEWATLPADVGFANPMTTAGQNIRGGTAGAPEAADGGSLLTTELDANADISLAHFQKGAVRANKGTELVLTIKAQADVAYLADARMELSNIGVGDLKVVGAAGVTLNGNVAGSVSLTTGQGAVLCRTAENVWWIFNYTGVAAP